MRGREGALLLGLALGCDGPGKERPTPADSATECMPAAWYIDADGDGNGDAAVVEEACEAPAGFVVSGDDCDDQDATVHPGAEERCDDGTDADCDGSDACADIDGSAIEDVLVGVTHGFGLGYRLHAVPGGVIVAGSHTDCDVYVWTGPLDGRRSVDDAARVLRGDSEDRQHLGSSIAPVGGTGRIALGSYGGPVVFDAQSDVPVLTYVGDWQNAYGGLDVDAGDVTGDGVTDLVFTGPELDVETGTVVVIDASSSGALGAGDEEAVITDASDEWVGGKHVVVLGDTDGDGSDDVLVDTRFFFRGPLYGVVDLGSADAETSESYAGGTDEARVGDVDGDGLADALVGATSVPGGAWISRMDGASFGSDTAFAVLACDGSDTSCGAQVWGDFDLNGDGHLDAAMRYDLDPAVEHQTGAWIVHGPLAGTILSSEAGQRVIGDSLPNSLDDLGAVDLDGDGSLELALGLYAYDDEAGGEGAVLVVPAAALRAAP